MIIIELAKNIIRLRKQKNITQEELGNVLGVSTAAVSKWETEKSIPDIYLLSELADFFHVSTDELLGRNFTKMTAAVVDDSKFIRENIVRILSQNDYEVLILAKNGKELLDNLYLPQVQVIILDLHMPEMDGFETLRLLKEKRPDIKVIICSKDSSEESIQKAQELGVDSYVTKPFQDKFLLLALQDLA